MEINLNLEAKQLAINLINADQERSFFTHPVRNLLSQTEKHGIQLAFSELSDDHLKKLLWEPGEYENFKIAVDKVDATIKDFKQQLLPHLTKAIPHWIEYKGEKWNFYKTDDEAMVRFNKPT